MLCALRAAQLEGAGYDYVARLLPYAPRFEKPAESAIDALSAGGNETGKHALGESERDSGPVLRRLTVLVRERQQLVGDPTADVVEGDLPKQMRLSRRNLTSASKNASARLYTILRIRRRCARQQR